MRIYNSSLVPKNRKFINLGLAKQKKIPGVDGIPMSNFLNAALNKCVEFGGLLLLLLLLILSSIY